MQWNGPFEKKQIALPFLAELISFFFFLKKTKKQKTIIRKTEQ